MPKLTRSRLFKFTLLSILFIGISAFPLYAQEAPVNISFGDDLLSSERIFQMFILLTVLSLAPSMVMMITSFTRIVVVFSFLRSALGLQASPPNTVMISLALFMTFFIMQPTLEAAYNAGVRPYLDDRIDEETAFTRSMEPFKEFMGSQVRENDLNLFIEMMPEDKKPAVIETSQDVPLQAMIPAFMISELRRAFEIGFLIFLPFLVIDLTVASILMSMGMMMLPPIIISLPFKIIFFVLVDGWHLLVGSLVESFKTAT